jgi:hypothetical protein
MATILSNFSIHMSDLLISTSHFWNLLFPMVQWCTFPSFLEFSREVGPIRHLCIYLSTSVSVSVSTYLSIIYLSIYYLSNLLSIYQLSIYLSIEREKVREIFYKEFMGLWSWQVPSFVFCQLETHKNQSESQQARDSERGQCFSLNSKAVKCLNSRRQVRRKVNFFPH